MQIRQATVPTGIASDINQDGSAGAARTIDEGDIWLLIDGAAGIIAVRRYDSANDEFDDI